jgi:hypothetical protein
MWPPAARRSDTRLFRDSIVPKYDSAFPGPARPERTSGERAHAPPCDGRRPQQRPIDPRTGILSLIDTEIERHTTDPRAAIRAIFGAIAADLDRATFRGCAFNNASIEFPDPQHPARTAARDYRHQLHQRLVTLADRIDAARGDALGDQLALVIDGMYTSAAHLGPAGPAAAGPALANALIATADV